MKRRQVRHGRWFRCIPTQEQILAYCFLKPVRHFLDHLGLWQFNRRSVVQQSVYSFQSRPRLHRFCARPAPLFCFKSIYPLQTFFCCCQVKHSGKSPYL